MDRDVAPDALHAAALVDLLWADDEGNSLRRSIQLLQTAARLHPRPAPILADLSAAHLVRAERAASPRDLLEAVETAERALQKDPGNRTALFNRALGLERFGLMGQARRAWRAYLAADSTSDWATTAWTRLAQVSRVPALPAAPGPNAADHELAAYAVADPQGARTLGWDRLLGEWGAAVLAGDTSKAADRLHRAEVLGTALERAGRDATLADAVRAIRKYAPDAAAAHTLAAAHRAYAEGIAALRKPDPATAAPRFAASERAATLSPAIVGWATAHAGAAQLLSGDAAGATPILQDLAARIDAQRYPALAGRIHSFRTTALLRMDRPQDAITTAQQAASLLERAGEPELEAGVLGIAADASFATGDLATGYSAAHRALQRLRPYGGTPPLHNALFALAETAAADGFTLFALHVQNEDVAVAAQSRDPLYQAEATLARARIRATAGQTALAQADLAAGRELVRRIAVADAQAWMAAEFHATEAAVTVATHPARASAALDSAIGFFEARSIPLKVLPALVTRAQARVRLKDAHGATRDLDRAIGILDDRRSGMGNQVLRAAVMDAAKSIIDRAVLLHLAVGRTGEALTLLDRGRASRAMSGARSRPGLPRLVAGETALSYTLVADTLLIWTVARGEISVARTQVDTAELARITERVRTALETNAGEAAVKAGLEALHGLLIRPVAPRLGRSGERLVIIADGELAMVPFAALRDRASGRYLVQDHPLRFATSLAEAARRAPRGARSDAAVVIADPAFDEVQNPVLERLDGAKAETDAVARHHPRTTVVEGKAATPSAVLASIREASLVHYAGHAVFDDDLPHRSYVVLAPEPRHPGRLTAEDVAGADLRNVRLVVLSACSTIRSGHGRSGGFIGLAGSFLSAGAGGVVGSLWRVDDRPTLAMMRAFHQAYSVTANAAESLRRAQIAMLDSRDPALRSPATWAGFRYTGP